MQGMRYLKRSMRGSAQLAVLALAAIGIGTGCNASSPSADNGVAASYQALAGALGNCRQTAAQCMQQAAGDTTQVQACKDAYSSCVDQAQAARQQLEQAIAACFSAARDCKAQDGGAGTRAACREQLRSCVQSNLPPPPPLPPCLQALQQCVQNGGQPKDCAQQAHQCILSNLPQGALDGGVLGRADRDNDADRGARAGDAGFAHKACDGGVGPFGAGAKPGFPGWRAGDGGAAWPPGPGLHGAAGSGAAPH